MGHVEEAMVRESVNMAVSQLKNILSRTGILACLYLVRQECLTYPKVELRHYRKTCSLDILISSLQIERRVRLLISTHNVKAHP